MCWVVANGLCTAGKHRMMPMEGEKRGIAARFRTKMVCWHRIKCPKSGLSETHERTIHCFIVPVVWYKVYRRCEKNPGQNNVVSVKL